MQIYVHFKAQRKFEIALTLPPCVFEILPMLKVMSAVRLEYCCSYDSIKDPMTGKKELQSSVVSPCLRSRLQNISLPVKSFLPVNKQGIPCLFTSHETIISIMPY